MKTIDKSVMMAGTIALFVLLGPTPTSAQDTLRVNADTVQLKFENSKVRVLEIVLPPGAKEHLHSHPSYLTYVLSGGRVRNHFPDGKVSEVEFKNGDVVYRDPVTHWGENVGTTSVHVILVELKTEK